MHLKTVAIGVVGALASSSLAQNVSTYYNPIITGFHPDPTCTFVPELDNTFFCTFSSFLTFPGLPIYASRDLINWKLVSNALSRLDQLPALAFLVRGSTSGIYAPTLRYRDGKLIILTSLASQAYYPTNYTKWDNFIQTSNDPYNSSAWSDPVHFDFPGIDPSPFWDDDGKVYLTGSFDGKSILQAEIDLDTGEVFGPLVPIWNGTGLPSPEAPHMYKRDGWYYLLTAEGGTRERHRSNFARSRNIYGPYVGDPANPVLSGYLSQSYFQAVGHSDIFQDALGQYWAIALAVRAGYSYNFDPYNSIFPMGREAQLTPVKWPTDEWPTYQNVSGIMTGDFVLPQNPDPSTVPEQGEGGLSQADDVVNFEPGSSLPAHVFHWRLPVAKNYAVSPQGHDNTLMLRSSVFNLTSFDADSTRGLGQTFVARRQSHTRFRFSVDVQWHGLLTREQNEVGVTALQDQAQHFDISVAMLKTNGTGAVAPHIRFRGISTITYRLPERFKYVDEAVPLPAHLYGQQVRLQVEAVNTTHYAFSAGRGGCDEETEMTVYGYTRGNYLIPYYSGVVVGVYATSNATSSFLHRSNLRPMKSKAAREKRQAWLSRREMDAASDGGSAPITTGAERAGALTQVMTETTGISPITTCNDAKPELIASTARNLVLRIKPDMASQQIDKRGNDLKAAASPKKSIDTASISLSEPQSRPPGISRNVTTPMENAIAKTEHSGAAPTPHGTIGNGCQSLENKRPESEARELSAGEKVFGIVELGEAILYKVSMRRLFLLRRVSKSFQNLIDNFTTLKASMFLVCLATRSDGSKDNPLAFSWSQRLPLFDPFEITRSGTWQKGIEEAALLCGG
ncbi:hypothetical protein B0A48_04182 [Cryoendolithus antarcticus]|uniref:Beta-xylosidase C-terminal Concanavalin A-like domain-containing protein n=1 Tax=Cryoendolithus antarcticus TaxID=1507870 RepID=A0A1V8TI12_9PEZI|nr:hypothetical protein B0A48_04182 [Cryoendolithus antarcticus]